MNFAFGVDLKLMTPKRFAEFCNGQIGHIHLQNHGFLQLTFPELQYLGGTCSVAVDNHAILQAEKILHPLIIGFSFVLRFDIEIGSNDSVIALI